MPNGSPRLSARTSKPRAGSCRHPGRRTATASRIIYSVDLEGRGKGRGNGRLIASFAPQQTAKEIPGRLKGYKSVLESESD